jgi:hypothetical protein
MDHKTVPAVPRRGFLAMVGAFAGFSALRPRMAPAASWRAAGPIPQGGWDMSWLDGLKGKHRQVFDLSDLTLGLLVVRNWYDAHQTVYGLHGAPELNAVVGIGGHAFPINASDALY